MIVSGHINNLRVIRLGNDKVKIFESKVAYMNNRLWLYKTIPEQTFSDIEDGHYSLFLKHEWTIGKFLQQFPIEGASFVAYAKIYSWGYFTTTMSFVLGKTIDQATEDETDDATTGDIEIDREIYYTKIANVTVDDTVTIDGSVNGMIIIPELKRHFTEGQLD